MSEVTAWIDETCRELGLRDVSPWVPWNRREDGAPVLARAAGDAEAGVYLIGWGCAERSIEVLYVGEAGDLQARLRQLENHVKWRMDYGFEALRELLEGRGDHLAMAQAWVKTIHIDETALFASPLLTPCQINAMGARRKQMEAILLAQHYRCFGAPVSGNREAPSLFLADVMSEASPVKPRHLAAA